MAKDEKEDSEVLLEVLKRWEADVRAGKLKGLAYVEVYDDYCLSVGMVGYAAGYPELAMSGISRLGYFANQIMDEDERSYRSERTGRGDEGEQCNQVLDEDERSGRETQD